MAPWWMVWWHPVGWWLGTRGPTRHSPWWLAPGWLWARRWWWWRVRRLRGGYVVPPPAPPSRLTRTVGVMGRLVWGPRWPWVALAEGVIMHPRHHPATHAQPLPRPQSQAQAQTPYPLSWSLTRTVRYKRQAWYKWPGKHTGPGRHGRHARWRLVCRAGTVRTASAVVGAAPRRTLGAVLMRRVP